MYMYPNTNYTEIGDSMLLNLGDGKCQSSIYKYI